MSNKHKIFGNHPRQGIQTIQGRNVQVTMPKIRNPDLSETAMTQRYDLSPFSGYSLSHSQTMIGQSQVTEMNAQSLRKMIKEEIEKAGRDEKNRNDINVMRTEIRSLKEKCQELEQNNSEEVKEDIQNSVCGLLEQYKIQTAKNLREVVKKIDQNIKKECLTQLGRQYIQVSFIDEVEKQFNELDDRLQLLQSKIEGNRNRSPHDSIILGETVELKLKKVQRQIESLKKTTSQAHSKLKEEVNQKHVEVEERLNEQIERITKMESDNHKQTKKSIVNLEHTKATVSDFNKLTEKIKKLDEQFTHRLVELSKKHSNSSLDVKEFLSSSKNLATSGIFQAEMELKQSKSSQQKQQKHPTTEKINQSEIRDIFISPKLQRNVSSPEVNKSPQKQEKKENKPVVRITYSSEVPEEGEKKAQEEKEEKEKVLYQVDDNSFLMDNQGTYILDVQDQMIKLDEEHLQMLRESNLIKYEQ